MTNTNIELQKNKYTAPLFIVGVLFFALGFITWLDAPLINFLKIACQIDNNVVLFFITSASYISFLVMSIPASLVLDKTGYKRGMALGLLVVALGALVFIPAASTRTYWVFLVGIFVQGAGMSLIQTAVNPYVTILGPLDSAAKRISMMGIANKVAGAISPLILSAFILSGAQAIENQLNTTVDAATKTGLLNSLAAKAIGPYIVMAIVAVVLAVWVWLSGLPELHQEDEVVEDNKTHETHSSKSIFQFPHLFIGVVALFLYVGCEVLTGDTIGQYGRMLGEGISRYQNFTTITLGFMVVGYILGIILIPKRVSQRTALIFCSILALIFSIVALFTAHSTSYFDIPFLGWINGSHTFSYQVHLNTSVFFIALCGFANSIMWPAIWPLALNKLGHHTKRASAFLVMAIAGGAVLSLLWGAIANVAGNQPQLTYLLLLPSYGFILFFAVRGYRAGLDLKKEAQTKQMVQPAGN